MPAEYVFESKKMRVLGLDLGTKTLGIAISDRLGLMANPYKTIKYENEDKLFLELDEIIKKEKVEKNKESEK